MKHTIHIHAVLFLVSATSLHAADSAKPVRVFILAGQSNMEGQGFIAVDSKRNEGKGSLEFLVKDPVTAPRFKHLVDTDGCIRCVGTRNVNDVLVLNRERTHVT